jgi:archaellum component FlaC
MKKNIRSSLIVSREDFCQKVNNQIAIGKGLSSQQITSDETLENLKNEISKWSDYNMELLKQSFDNPDNEYLKEYKAGYKHWSYIGSHPFSEKVETQKKKIASYITYLEKLNNKIELIPVNADR